MEEYQDIVRLTDEMCRTAGIETLTEETIAEIGQDFFKQTYVKTKR